jgi:hypothetical protein
MNVTMRFLAAALMGLTVSMTNVRADEAVLRPVDFDSAPGCNDRPAPGTFNYTLMTVVESDALTAGQNERTGEPIYVLIRFYALTDTQGDIIGMMTYRSDQSVAKVYGLCDIRTGNVKVMQNGDSGRLLAQIQSAGFTGQHGGSVTLNHIYNGINGVYRSVHFDVAREGGNWRLYWDLEQTHARDEPFNYLFMHGRRVIIAGLVGISRLEPKLKSAAQMQEYASRPLPLPTR